MLVYIKNFSLNTITVVFQEMNDKYVLTAKYEDVPKRESYLDVLMKKKQLSVSRLEGRKIWYSLTDNGFRRNNERENSL